MFTLILKSLSIVSAKTASKYKEIVLIVTMEYAYILLNFMIIP